MFCKILLFKLIILSETYIFSDLENHCWRTFQSYTFTSSLILLKTYSSQEIQVFKWSICKFQFSQKPFPQNSGSSSLELRNSEFDHHLGTVRGEFLQEQNFRLLWDFSRFSHVFLPILTKIRPFENLLYFLKILKMQ